MYSLWIPCSSSPNNISTFSPELSRADSSATRAFTLLKNLVTVVSHLFASAKTPSRTSIPSFHPPIKKTTLSPLAVHPPRSSASRIDTKFLSDFDIFDP